MLVLLMVEELRAARVEQCAVGLHGHAVAADQSHVEVQHFIIAISHESHEVGLEGRGHGIALWQDRRDPAGRDRKGAAPKMRRQWHEVRMIGPEEWYRGEGVPLIFIAQAELPIAISPTGEHRRFDYLLRVHQSCFVSAP